MAERGATAVAYSDLVEFEAFRRSSYMGLAYRGLQGDFQRARQVTLNTLTDNIAVDTPADSEALETAPSRTTADMSLTTYDRKLVRGASRYNVLQAMEGPGPARLDMSLIDRMGASIAQEVDTQGFAQLTGATYNNASGNGFTVESVGTAFSNSNAAGLDRNTGRYKSKGTAPSSRDEILQAIVDSIADGEVRFRNNNIMGGELVGDLMPTGYAFVCHPIVGRALVDWAQSNGELDLRGSAGREAATASGILGTTAYQGTIRNFDVVTTTALKVASNAASQRAFFVPIGSALVGGIRPMLWDFARFGQGNTQGRAVAETTVIQPYFAGRAETENLGQLLIAIG